MNYSLYFITDRNLSRGISLLDTVKASVYGGITIVQLREKNCSTKDFINNALSLKFFLKQHNIPLIINDRIDVALAVEADGIHLGQDDMPAKTARKIVKDKMIIGISANTIDEAVCAEKDGADYLGVGPIYPTNTKKNAVKPIGIDGLKEIKKNIKIPIVAIGGLNINNIYEVINNGADGIAVVSAIAASDNPEYASFELRKIIDMRKK